MPLTAQQQSAFDQHIAAATAKLAQSKEAATVNVTPKLNEAKFRLDEAATSLLSAATVLGAAIED